jgi:hypothetical protein
LVAEVASEQSEVIDPERPRPKSIMAFDERSNARGCAVFEASEGDMRLELTAFGLETGADDGSLHSFVKTRQQLLFFHARPKGANLASRLETTDAGDSQIEPRRSHAAEHIVNFVCITQTDLANEAKG